MSNTSSRSSESQPLMKDVRSPIPRASWAKPVPSARDPSRLLPQAIAHRGNKALWPENSMGGFRSAIEVGAHALETDVHLSADGVAVLSHDGSLKRCFGVDKKISECRWDYLATLQTVREPKQGLPRLRDLLGVLAEPGMEKIWVLLDIKIDDAAEDLMSAIAKAMEDVPGPVPWDQRIILGCWNATFLQTARRLLPSHPLAHISASLLYSHHFMKIPNLGFNMAQKALIGLPGHWFLRDVQAADRQLFVWTVNDEKWMEWCIRKNLGSPGKSVKALRGDVLVDGVITDDPRKFLAVCERYEDEMDGKRVRVRKGVVERVGEGVKTACLVVAIQMMVMGFHMLRRWQGKFDYLKDRRSLDKR